jgi:hypothetical protein
MRPAGMSFPGAPSRHDHEYGRQERAALRRVQRGLFRVRPSGALEHQASCLCKSRGLVNEKQTRCPEHGVLVALAPNRQGRG